jgi:hypothetical protein
MADTILTLSEIKKVFYDLTKIMVNVLTEVRMSWPTGGAPAFDINDNMVFLRITTVPSPTMHMQREDKYSQVGSPEEGNMQTGYTRILEIGWIFYGQNSWDDANMVNNKIFYQENHDILARKNLYLVPNFDPPRRMPEPWQGLWYERVDLKMNFNERVVVNYPVPYLESARIIVVDHSGVIHEEEINSGTIVRQGG